MDAPPNTPAPTRFDVFLSHSSKDRNIANAACSRLEQGGIRCWMSPRDIVPGADWGESIIAGLDSSRVFVLIFSGHANESPQVKREVERAVAKGIPIIPVRIEDVVPHKSLEYFISSAHWLDAFPPPLERYLESLADSIHRLLDTPVSVGARIAVVASKRRSGMWLLIPGLLLISAPGVWFSLRKHNVSPRMQVTASQYGRLPIQLDKDAYEEGDVATVALDIPQSGHLRLYSVDANGNVLLLFPNRWQPNDLVPKGHFVLPGDDSEWDIVTVLQEQQTFTRESMNAVLSSEPFPSSPTFDDSGFSIVKQAAKQELSRGGANIWQGKASYMISK